MNVVIYQSSDGLIKMAAIVGASNETIWATQKAMAQLLGVNISGISRHLVNVFSSGELDEKSNLHKCKFRQTGCSEPRMTSPSIAASVRSIRYGMDRDNRFRNDTLSVIWAFLRTTHQFKESGRCQ